MSGGDLKGGRELRAKLQAMATGMPGAIAAALLEWGYSVMGQSVRLVPVCTGRLRSSAYVEVQEESGRLVLHLGYGTDYALIVHERLDVRHPHGQAKYLQQPLEAALAGFGAFMAARVPELLKSGATAPVGRQGVG